MRITSTTSSPVITKEMTAAGPAALMTTPLPTKRPAPMTPPRAIIIMCRCFKLWRSPLEGGGVLFTLGSAGIPIIKESRGRLRHARQTQIPPCLRTLSEPVIDGRGRNQPDDPRNIYAADCAVEGPGIKRTCNEGQLQQDAKHIAPDSR